MISDMEETCDCSKRTVFYKRDDWDALGRGTQHVAATPVGRNNVNANRNSEGQKNLFKGSANDKTETIERVVKTNLYNQHSRLEKVWQK